MIKKDLVADIAFTLGVTQKQVKPVINIMEQVIIDEVAKGGFVNLRGFGVFKSVTHKEKVCNLPTTTQKVIPEHRRAKFQPGKIFNAKMK